MWLSIYRWNVSVIKCQILQQESLAAKQVYSKMKFFYVKMSNQMKPQRQKFENIIIVKTQPIKVNGVGTTTCLLCGYFH